MKQQQRWLSRLAAFVQESKSAGKHRRSFGKKTTRLLLEQLEDLTLLSPVAPIASNDVQPVDGTIPLVLQSLSYFSEVDGATLIPSSVRITTPPSDGTATINTTTGNITYIAKAGFVGTDQVGFTVADTNGLTSQPAYVSEVVTLPTAIPDSATTEAGQKVTIAVLANDASVAAPINPASVVVSSAPSHGTYAVNTTTGAIAYTPSATFSGTDSFGYTFEDTNGVASNQATVTVVVTRPEASNIAVTTSTNAAAVVDIFAEVAGPSQLVPSSVKVVNAPAHGTTTINTANGDVTYLPSTGYSGPDSFTYNVTDVNGAVSNTATVAIAVQQPLTGTVVNPIAILTDAGQAVLINVLAVDNDPVGFNPSTVAVQSGPSNGSTSVNSTTGAITYTPKSGFAGTDAFTYSVKDKNNDAAGTATVTIVVSSPKANNTVGVVSAGDSVVINVLASDTDDDNALVPSTVKIVTPPAYGTAVVNTTTGDVTYTANATFAGIDSFTYTVADANNVVSNPATVTILSDRPGAGDEFGTTDSGHTITIDTLAADTDPAGPAALVPSSVTILSGPSNGTATIDPATGNINYTSIFGFNGTDTLTYTVADTNGAVSNVGTITIVVNRPTAEPDSATTPENTAVSFNIAANDSDPDGNQYLNPASIVVSTKPTNGSVSVNSVGVATYTPAYGFVGTDTFAYTIADDNGATSNPAIDKVTVTASTQPAPTLVLLPTQPAPPSTAGQSANTLFVGGLYRDILGRQGSASELSGWVSALQTGTTPATVAQDILHSTEYLTNEVMGYYQTFLNRAGDSAGVAGWVTALQNGATEQQVVLGFLTSPEFMSKHNTSTAYVADLYSQVLGRTGTSAEIAAWTTLISKGLTEAQVAQSFLNSTETQSDVVNAYYLAMLARPADTSGLTAWLGTLQQGSTLDKVLLSILNSSEYAQDLSLGIR